MQKEREEKLIELLKNRLHDYVQGNKDDFIRNAEAEVARLSKAGDVFLYYNILYQGRVTSLKAKA